MWVQSLGREDPLEEVTAPHSNILAWRIPWTEESGGLQSVRWTERKLDMTETTQQALMLDILLMTPAKSRIIPKQIRSTLEIAKYSTWNSVQHYTAAWKGGDFEGEWIHVYV